MWVRAIVGILFILASPAIINLPPPYSEYHLCLSEARPIYHNQHNICNVSDPRNELLGNNLSPPKLSFLSELVFLRESRGSVIAVSGGETIIGIGVIDIGAGQCGVLCLQVQLQSLQSNLSFACVIGSPLMPH